MNVTTTYYRDFNHYHWFTRIGKFSFYSVAKPTARQIRRWKKRAKRISWSEYKVMVNGHYGKFGKNVSALFICDAGVSIGYRTDNTAFIRGRRIGFSYTDQANILEKLKSITGTEEGLVNYNFPTDLSLGQ